MNTREKQFESLIKDKRLSNAIDFGDKILIRCKDGMRFKNNTNEFMGLLSECLHAVSYLK